MSAVERRPYKGFVYNLETPVGWYETSNGIVVHNCRCSMVAIEAKPERRREREEERPKEPDRDGIRGPEVPQAASALAIAAAAVAARAQIAGVVLAMPGAAARIVEVMRLNFRRAGIGSADETARLFVPEEWERLGIEPEDWESVDPEELAAFATGATETIEAFPEVWDRVEGTFLGDIAEELPYIQELSDLSMMPGGIVKGGARRPLIFEETQRFHPPYATEEVSARLDELFDTVFRRAAEMGRLRGSIWVSEPSIEEFNRAFASHIRWLLDDVHGHEAALVRLKKMLALLKERHGVDLDPDEIEAAFALGLAPGAPAWARDLVEGLARLVDEAAPGRAAARVFRPGDTRRLPARTESLEALVTRGGLALYREKARLRLAIDAGENVERNVRDLAVLEGEFLHADDTKDFLKALNQHPYTEAEKDALWDYAGLHREQLETGGVIIGKGPVRRFHRKLRDPEQYGPLTPAEQQTMDLVDQAIARNVLPRDVTLFRGAAFYTEYVERLKRAGPGTIIRDEAPTYTGLTEARALPHARNALESPSSHTQVLFEIQAKKGTPAISSPYGIALPGRKIPVPGYYVGGRRIGPRRMRVPFLQRFNKEEIVLARNQGLRILNHYTRPDGVVVFIVETVA